MEVARPHATYELTIRTAMSRGAPVPTGRINLPREGKPKKELRILVFAEGRQAEEAKRAGAHVVGGLDLVESVRSISTYLTVYRVIACRSQLENIIIVLQFFALLVLSVASRLNWDVYWVLEVSCRLSVGVLLPTILRGTSCGCLALPNGEGTSLALFACQSQKWGHHLLSDRLNPSQFRWVSPIVAFSNRRHREERQIIRG